MARIDYFAIQEAIAQQIRDDADVSETVVVEEALTFEREPKVFVYLERRDAPESRQSIAAGTRTRFLVRYTVVCWAFSLESMAKASEVRDDLLGKVELALMNDRQFGRSDVHTSWITGGDFDSARTDDGYGLAAEINLTVDVSAINA